MQEFANVPQGQNNITTVAVLLKHTDRNNDVIVLGYNNTHWVVACGLNCEIYPRTIQGLTHATAEYESCVYNDLILRCPNI